MMNGLTKPYIYDTKFVYPCLQSPDKFCFISSCTVSLISAVDQLDASYLSRKSDMALI